MVGIDSVRIVCPYRWGVVRATKIGIVVVLSLSVPLSPSQYGFI